MCLPAPDVTGAGYKPGRQAAGAVCPPSFQATGAMCQPTSQTDRVISAAIRAGSAASVCHASASSSSGPPVSPEADLAEDDHLSQLFPDADLPALSDDEALLEDEASDLPKLEPLTEQEENQAKAQTANWWKDKPLDRVPMVEIPFFAPLTDKNSQTVLQGLMRLHTEVKALGLPLVRLHSDRGREFINRRVTAWTLHHGIVQTSTSGDDWKANGRTENWVRLLKRSTRTLLIAHGASPSQWAFAMRHAAARLQAAALSVLGVAQPRLLPWHASLALRRRSWETKQPWTERVTRATVLCPSPVLRGGHLVRTSDGSFVHTEALVEVAEVVELQAYEPHESRTRLRGKQPAVVASACPSALDASSAPSSPRFAVAQRGGACDNGDQMQARSGGESNGSGSEAPFSSCDNGDQMQARSGGESNGSGSEAPFSFSLHSSPSLPRGILRGILTKRDGRGYPKKVRFDLPVRREVDDKPSHITSLSHLETVAEALDGLPRVPTSSLLPLLQTSGAPYALGSSVAKRDPWTYGILVGNTGPGITPVTEDRPWLTKLLCRVVKACNPCLSFASISITRNQGRSCRQDPEKEKGSQCLLVPLSSFQGGQLWIEDERAEGPEVVFRRCSGDPDGYLRRGKVFEVWPSLTFDVGCFHEVQEFHGDRWMLEAFTPKGWQGLPSQQQEHLIALGFSLPYAAVLPLPLPTVRMLAFDANSTAGLDHPVYECVGAARVLSQCRISVMKVLDCVQDNLKKWGSEVKAFWGRANSQGEGEIPAALLRDTEVQVCNLQSTLEAARALEEEECPPLSPSEQWKELACLHPEPYLQSRVCVAHAQDDAFSLADCQKEVPLQTRTLTLGEVLLELEAWKPSWGEEYNSLVVAHKAVEPLPAETLQHWRAQEKKFQVIPSKLVHTLKAHTGRKKTRCVCCGNMEEVSLFNRNECYAGGVDATALRAVLRMAASWEWSISSFDVKTAFLQSRLLDKHDVPTVVKTPWLWRKHGICSEEFWLVKGALYGLCISPRSWCESRDATMSGAKTCLDGYEISLRRFQSDPNLWWIVGVRPDESEANLGIVAWYIDDALILACQSRAKAFTEFVAGLWNTTPPEYLLPGQVLVYNGFEIEQDGPCLRLHQRSFLTELLSRYPGEERSDIPALPIPPCPEEETDVLLTRRCQALCGELLWLSIRTRPELCYAVNMMAQRMARWPKEAWDRGLQILRYLRKHPGVSLAYGGQRSGFLTKATAMSDASFAPSAERSHQCTLTFLGDCLITWHSTRQPFITQSTCEAELVALCSALSDIEAQLPLYEELLPAVQWTKELLCDNKSAVAICQAPFGSWRSRHLHLRANVIKERLSQGWTLRHQPGAEMLADIGTKPLASGRFLELMLGLGLHVPSAGPKKPQVRSLSLPTRLTSFAEGGLDVESVPSEAKCQSLLRAWILLEVIGSLPVREAASVGSQEAPPADETLSAYFAGFVVILVLWVSGCQYQKRAALAVVAAGVAIYHGFHKLLPTWSWTLALGFGLGWISRDGLRCLKHEDYRESGSEARPLSTTLESEGAASVARLAESNTGWDLRSESRGGLWVAYGDDLGWVEDSADICLPQLCSWLSVKEFSKLRLTCRGFQGKVSLILRRADRDRSLLEWDHRYFLDIPGVIARDLGQPSDYEPSNFEVRRWVQDYRQAEDRFLRSQDSEEEPEGYDPDEHVGFHAAVAAYYLVNLGYQFEVEDVDPDFQLWFGRIRESPPPLDLREDSNRIASAAAFLNFQGYFFDHEQLPEEILEEYEEQLGRQHIQAYRDP